MPIIAIVLLLLSLATPSHAEIKLVVQLSVDHEGDTLDENDLRAMETFRKQHPDVPLIQFLNPAYYTKEWSDPALTDGEITRRIRRTLLPIDELGLHIHGWQRMIEAVPGVQFRSLPSFWSDHKSRERNGEAGDDVPFAAYTEQEATRIIAFGLQLLAHHGFAPLTSFRAGGWASASHTRKALVANGLFVDGSPVPAELVANLYPDTNLVRFSQELWPSISQTSQPYPETHGLHQVWLFPDNGGLADYLSADQFMKIVRANVAFARDQGLETVFVHYGFHQETAYEYLHRVARVLRKLKAYSTAAGIQLIIGTYQQARCQGLLQPH